MEDDNRGGAGALRGLKLVGKVVITRRKYKCTHVPLVKLASFLTKLRNGEGVLVAVETSHFSIESIAALSKAYGAELEVLSSRDDLVTLVIRK